MQLTNNTMSSLELARVTGKNHKELLRSIRRMEKAWEETTERTFALSEYADKSGKRNVMYNLNKTESLYVATKFNDQARAKVILRWEELEKANNTVVAYADDPIIGLRVKQIALEKRVKTLEAKATTRLETFTIAGYAALNNMLMPLKLASSLGRKATTLCKQAGIVPDEIPDPRFGRVKSYPKAILEQVFNASIV